MMKALTPIFAVGLALFSQVIAVEPAKPAVTLTVKRQLIDSDHDLRGGHGSSKEKTFTLKIEISNTTSSLIGASELSGDVLVSRALGERDRIVKESIGSVKLPAMKPNERLTLSLGKIKLSEFEWGKRKFEETLEEWKVTCKIGETVIGENLSTERYTTLEKAVVPDAPKFDGPGRPFGPRPGPIRRLGD